MTFDDWLSDMTKLVSFARAYRAEWDAFSAAYATFPGKLARRARTRPHEPHSSVWEHGARKLGAFALLHAEQFRHFSIHYSKEERS